MSAKRDKFGIIQDILVLVRSKDGACGPTQIMYRANLSHQMLTEYTSEMLAKGFIEEKILKGGKRTYSITQKGHQFLKDYQSIRKFIDSYGF